MHYKVELLPTVWEDLKEIEDYYLLEFDVETAIKVSDNILNYIERLGTFLDLGSLTPDVWLNKLGYRMVICEQHVAIYKVVQDTAYVYHIADTRKDYTKLFQDESNE